MIFYPCGVSSYRGFTVLYITKTGTENSTVIASNTSKNYTQKIACNFFCFLTLTLNNDFVFSGTGAYAQKRNKYEWLKKRKKTFSSIKELNSSHFKRTVNTWMFFLSTIAVYKIFFSVVYVCVSTPTQYFALRNGPQNSFPATCKQTFHHCVS